MPRTLPEEWTKTEPLAEPIHDTRSYGHRHGVMRGIAVVSTSVTRAGRAVKWQSYRALQREDWICPYCKWHSSAHGKIRRRTAQEQFYQLANTWKQETGHLSNITTRAMHPAYQRIIGMGKEAIPLILEEFRKGKLDDWFWALYAITGDNPIAEEIAGDMDKMAEAWLQWGRETGYLSDSIPQMRPSSQT
jgi:hypothetical protein